LKHCKRAIQLVAALAILTGTSATNADEDSGNSEIKPMCATTIATVMVGKMACSASSCNGDRIPPGLGALLAMAGQQHLDSAAFSNGVAAMLVTALKETGCFEVFDAASLEELRKEMESLGQQIAPPPPVDYLVKATITKADVVRTTRNFVVVSRATTTSTLKLDIKLVNAKRGTIWDAGAYEASSDRSSTGVSTVLYSSHDSSGRQGTPLSEVAREAIGKAAVGVTTKILAQQESAAGIAQTQPEK
jgi:curli biogenesis system outer membrane secretion channel CsgG